MVLGVLVPAPLWRFIGRYGGGEEDGMQADGSQNVGEATHTQHYENT
jgi:hypothetical protein